LVPTIADGESKHFVVRFGLLTDESQIKASVANIDQ